MAAEVHRRTSLNISALTKLSTQRKSTSLHQTHFQTQSEQPQAMAIKIANTFRTEPEESKRFRCRDVKHTIDSVLTARLDGLSYDSEKCRILLPSIADEIKNKVKLLGFERFKLVCIVTIGKLNNQGIRVTSRCLWDTTMDRMATSSFCSEDLFASASVFGIYQE